MFIPCVASLSASSFPSLLLWPLVHFMTVLPFRCLILSIASQNHSLLLISVHPRSSQFGKFFVRPSIAYLESVVIRRLVSDGVSSTAFIIAYSSPV